MRARGLGDVGALDIEHGQFIQIIIPLGIGQLVHERQNGVFFGEKNIAQLLA